MYLFVVVIVVGMGGYVCVRERERKKIKRTVP